MHLTRKNSGDDGLGDVVELVDIFDRSDHFGAFQNDGKETDRKLTNSSTSPKFPRKGLARRIINKDIIKDTKMSICPFNSAIL